MKYDELSDEAKEFAYSEFCDIIAHENDWWQPLMDDLQAELKSKYGLTNVDVEFQLAYVQSDTVLFHIDHAPITDKLLTGLELGTADEIVEQLVVDYNIPRKYIPELKNELLHNSNVTGEVGITNPSGLDVDLDGFYEAVLEYAEKENVDPVRVREDTHGFIEYKVNYDLYERAKQFYRELDEESEVAFSEDALRDAQEANEWEFNADGNLFW